MNAKHTPENLTGLTHTGSGSCATTATVHGGNTASARTRDRFTPGPWHILNEALIRDARDRSIASVHFRATAARKSDAPPVPESEGNARLIAAAPDLLAALRAIEARITGTFDDPDLMAHGPLTDKSDCDCLDIIRAAVAKATG